ncbi:MAG: VIT1/CCC1 transporter family protein [Candidatus Protochlamydia sp.]|nr:VIT1/CCC1 transporter family protein [Candidatus Protochlamydia sp.]
MNPSAHFKSKDAVAHVAEAQAKGLIDSAETHATEQPGSLSSGIDAARETVTLLLLLSLLLPLSPIGQLFTGYCIFLFAWMIWKMGRSARLGWARLEKLHRILEEERWEIEHNRMQEKEELKALYAAKGFEGRLLEEVLDVLMADGNRLLKVMVEEELGLSLGTYEHPLLQALGAGLGVFLAGSLLLFFFWVWPSYGMIAGAFFTIVFCSYLTAKWEKNRIIPSMVWNLAITALSVGAAYFLLLTIQNR